MRGIKRMLLIAFAMMVLLSLSGCCIRHDWVEATCEVPKTCSKCGKTEGEALGHEWVEATCEAPKTCSRCGKTEGEALGHKWVEATCENPKTCSVCGKTEGEALGHKWLENTPNYQQPKTCEVCGATEGEPLEAYCKDWEFAELDKDYDFSLKWSFPDEDGYATKVWFTNYKVFDSDETHEAKEGYEYRSVECWSAGYGAIPSSGFYGICDYYEGCDPDEVSYYGESFPCITGGYEKMEDTGWTNGSKYDYSKWGWAEDQTRTCEYVYTVLVPKGYDGAVIAFLNIAEYSSNLKENQSIEERLKECENVVWFRFK